MEHSKSERGVLIAGAGYAGLVSACELARRGLPFRIIDAQAEPPGFRSGSRGKGIQPRTLEIYDDLGIIDDVHREGGPYPQAMSWAGSKQLGLAKFNRIQRHDPTPDIPYPSMWMLPQPQALGVLRRHLEQLGGKVEFGVTLSSFQQDAEGVDAVFTHADGKTETIRTLYLIGADGARGTVRAGTAVEFASETLDKHPMITADVVVDGLEPTHWHMWDDAKGGALWLGPLVGMNAFQLYAKFENEEPDLSFPALQKLIHDRTEMPELVLKDVLFSSHFGSRSGMARHFRLGRVLLAGDAAHVHPPAGGQGMNTSVQDAYNLGWKLGQVLKYGAPDRLIDSYEEERLPVAAKLLEFVSQLHKDWLGKGKDKEESRQGEHAQLSLNYRNSPLTLDLREGMPNTVIRAGDRAPDARLVDMANAHSRMFDVLRGPHFTLLAIDAASPSLPSRYGDAVKSVSIVGRGGEVNENAFADADGYVEKNYGSGIVIVRPDGYVGYAGPEGAPRLNDYLSQFFAQ
ncbi:MAG TPA: FAD-dependent monooxygenase [Xanthobacteraceae bacterium]|jgi:2-polyprenyl-6-methoxyphenol hydroxylase-like FAD-dependent oxidoreductase|nr:FAD-dependent monooxygenase [Xanthobacteraceae bacterium]